MPKVSICIPCYNNAQEVERLINSIIIQTYKNYEIVISDDSTNCETQELIKEIAREHDYLDIVYSHNDEPYGHIYNWNVPIRKATGEYIKIMFSDDWFTYEDSLEKWVKMLDDNPDAMLAFAGSRQVMLDMDKIDKLGHVEAENQKASYDRYAEDVFIEELRKDYRYLFLGNQIGAPSAVIYRRGKEVVLFDENSNWASDMFVYFDLLRISSEFAYTKEPLVSIGVHENQYTEMFKKNDMRVYNDYRYLYTKYDLHESESCKEYMLKKFIVQYRKNYKEAKSLHISLSEYIKEKTKGYISSVKKYVNYHFGKK